MNKNKGETDMEKISGVYKIENIITGDFYIGSSKDIKLRWVAHRCPSVWKKLPNSTMYHDMQKYGVENFQLTILCEVEPEQLTVMEQKMIEELCPTYNNYYANGQNMKRHKQQVKKAQRIYNQSEKGKEHNRKRNKKYLSQLCLYKGETVKLGTLAKRFRKAGIKNPTQEAKKYLIGTK